MRRLSDVANLALSAKKICGPSGDSTSTSMSIQPIVLEGSNPPEPEPLMISALSRAYAVLACLEPLLLRKDAVTEMVENADVLGLINLLKAGLGTPRFLLTSLVCSIDSTPHSIGD